MDLQVTVCTAGGCTTSPSTLMRTRETAPLLVTPPVISVINSTALKVMWQVPLATNGKITRFDLKMNGVILYSGLDLTHTQAGLTPYLEYTFVLVSCTIGGCTNSGEVKGRPDDDIPRGLMAPRLRVLSSRSIEINWSPPQEPNGIINSYDLRRDDNLIYTESVSSSGALRTTFTDYDLQPGVEYSYKVTARNRKGSVDSLLSIATTFASSPSGLAAPALKALSSTSVQVSWMPPAQPNGVIKNYTLYNENKVRNT